MIYADKKNIYSLHFKQKLLAALMWLKRLPRKTLEAFKRLPRLIAEELFGIGKGVHGDD